MRSTTPDPEQLAFSSMIFYSITGALGMIGAMYAALPLWNKNFSLIEHGFWLFFGIITGLIFHILTRISGSTRSPVRQYINDMGATVFEILGPLNRQVIFQIALYSGISEEIVFRGLLQGFGARYMGNTSSIILVSLLFGLIHIPAERRMRLWPLFAFFAGLCLGLLRIAEGGIIACSAAHITVNYYNLRTIMMRGSQEEDKGEA